MGSSERMTGFERPQPALTLNLLKGHFVAAHGANSVAGVHEAEHPADIGGHEPRLTVEQDRADVAVLKLEESGVGVHGDLGRANFGHISGATDQSSPAKKEADVEDAPIGYRDPEDVAQYQQPPHDRRVIPDTVSASIEGYFRFPAIWVGEKPEATSVLTLNPAVHHEIVYEAPLNCGIHVRATRDGHFLFDFSKWPIAPQITIPGYTRPSENGPCSVPRFHSEAEDQAELYAVVRAQVMNAHQACLTTAERVVKQRGAGMGFPVTAWSTEKAITFRLPTSYHEDIEDMHALARNVLNNSVGVPRTQPLSRRVIELDVVAYSFKLLDQILSHPETRLVQLVETIYIAACRSREKRFGEAITLSWGVCEQLTSVVWKGIIDSRRTGSSDEMNKERVKKLTGRDFTASIVLETLELMGKIEHDLFRRLNIVRHARNKWAHELVPPKESQIGVAIRAAEQLLAQVSGVNLMLQPGGRGGVPQWAVFINEQVRKREGR